MNRKFIVTLAIAAGGVLVANAQKVSTVKLSGTLASNQHQKVYLQKYIDRYYEVIDSAVVENGKFSFSNQIVLPEIYGLSVSLKDTPLLVFLDEGDIHVDLNPARGYQESKIIGSATHDLYLEFHKDRNSDLTTFIQQHPHSIVSLYVLYREYVSRLSSAEIKRDLGFLDAHLQQLSYADILRQVIDTRKVTDIGQQAPDFSISDIDGKTVKLSEFIGQGYLLLDFWASWCGPCRKENPNVVEAYNKYHNQGFDVLAVSLDKTKEAWLRGIEEDGLKYHHVSELKYWNSDVARLYGIRSIPSNLLINSEGKIVAKNLRGNELQEVLSQFIKTN